MAVLRAHVERVERGPRRGLPRPDRHRAPAGRRAAGQGGRHETTGLACSIGIGPNKLVAKVASDADKPDGFLVLTRGEARRAVRRRLPRADPRHRAEDGRAARRSAASSALEQLAATSEADLVGVVRRRGWARSSAAWRASRTTARSRPVRVRKSESRETTFDRDLSGLAELEPVLERLATQLCDDLARNGRRGRTIGIKVRLDDFSTLTRARTLRRADQRARDGAPASRSSCCASSTRRGRCACSACAWPGWRSGRRRLPPLRPPGRWPARALAGSRASASTRPCRCRRSRALLRGGGEVPLATGRVGPAVDHRHRDRAAAVAERDARAAGQRAVRHAHRARRQRTAAGGRVAVQAGPVPRRVGGAVDMDARQPVTGCCRGRTTGEAHPQADSGLPRVATSRPGSAHRDRCAFDRRCASPAAFAAGDGSACRAGVDAGGRAP